MRRSPASPLGILVVLIFAGALAAAYLSDDQTLKTSMFSGALVLAGTVVNYYFGSSEGSRSKDAARSAEAAAPPPLPTDPAAFWASLKPKPPSNESEKRDIPPPAAATP